MNAPDDAFGDEPRKRIVAAPLPREEPVVDLDPKEPSEPAERPPAATNTVNERLMAELERQERVTKTGSASPDRLSPFGRPLKSEEEREAAIAEARDLNGVNPLVALGGAGFAFAAAWGLWLTTGVAGDYFAAHPVESDAYFVQRTTAVFRNLVVGLLSLASGFCGVTGLGLFFLGLKVADGVRKGELDPTPIKQKAENDIEMPDVWGLMMGNKSRRKSGGGGNNPFS